MGDKNRRAGLISVQIDGRMIEAKGAYTLNVGQPKRVAIIGADGVHGYKETPQVPFIEGATTDHVDLDVAALANATNMTVTLGLNNGKSWVLEDAWYAGTAEMSTDEGEINVRFESRTPAIEMK